MKYPIINRKGLPSLCLCSSAPLSLSSLLIITYFQIHSILTNKPNFRNDKMNITLDMTTNYKILYRSPGQKNKANSKPIKAKTNPIKANSNPIQTQSKPICRKGKKKNFLPIALFPLTSSTAPDYNEVFSQISCSQRTPIKRSWK